MKNKFGIENCQKFSQQLKAILENSPALSSPNFNKVLKFAVDASDVGARAVLLQEHSYGVDHPVCYFSRTFVHQRNYSTVEKECLALVLAMQHFEIFLTCYKKPNTVFSDNNPLTFLHKIKTKIKGVSDGVYCCKRELERKEKEKAREMKKDSKRKVEVNTESLK